ncbi:MAG: V-type ATP synthase subunit E, partial [Candidatus Ranarchaeia archaeon]
MEKSAAVEKIRQRILSQAKKQAADIRMDAEERASEIMGKAKEKADIQLKTELEKRREQVQDQVRRELGQEKVELHRHLLSYRSDLVDQLFEEAMENLRSYRKKKAYKTTLRKLIEESGSKIGSDTIYIQLNRSDLEWFTDEIRSKIEKAISKVTNHDVSIKVLEEPHSGIGGVIISNDDRSATIDNTLEARLERVKDEIRSDVERLL